MRVPKKRAVGCRQKLQCERQLDSAMPCPECPRRIDVDALLVHGGGCGRAMADEAQNGRDQINRAIHGRVGVFITSSACEQVMQLTSIILRWFSAQPDGGGGNLGAKLSAAVLIGELFDWWKNGELLILK